MADTKLSSLDPIAINSVDHSLQQKEDDYVPFTIHKRPRHDTPLSSRQTKSPSPRSPFSPPLRQKRYRNIFNAQINSYGMIQDMEDGVAEGLEYDEISDQLGVQKGDAAYPKLQRQYSSMKMSRESGRMSVISDCYSFSRFKSINSESFLSEHKYDDQWVKPAQIDDIDHENDEPQSPLTGKCKQFREQIQENLIGALFDYEEFNTKSAIDLYIDTEIEDCCNAQSGNEHSFEVIKEQCPCFQRIHVVMEAYHKLLNSKDDEIRRNVKMYQVIECDHYGVQQLADDFLHILSVHISRDNDQIQNCELETDGDDGLTDHIRESIGQQNARYFIETFPCGETAGDMGHCKAVHQHWRIRQTSMESAGILQSRSMKRLFTRQQFGTLTDEDIVLQNECDKIHIYFLQFGNQSY